METINTGSPSESLDIPGLNLLPEKWMGWVLLLIALSPYITRGYYALANGGGLKGVMSAIWIGTNTPKTTTVTTIAETKNENT